MAIYDANYRVVTNWLAQRAKATGDRIALEFANKTWTFAEMEAEALQLAAKLSEIGIGRNCKVGILMENQENYIFLIHALTKLESIAVLLNTRLTAKELHWQLQDSAAHYLVCDRQMHEEPLLKGEGGERGNQDFKPLSSQERRWGEVMIISTESLQAAQSSYPNSFNPKETIDLDAVQAILYTSGTTGKPKGVQLTYGNHFHSAIASAKNLESDQDIWLICIPLFHVGGLSIIWRSVIDGTAIVLLPRFDLDLAIAAIATGKPTLVSLVPTMLARILDRLSAENVLQQLENWQKLRGILLGGAALCSPLLDRCLELNLPIMPTYGMTETASQVATLRSQDLVRKRGSVGKPLSCNQVRIVGCDSLLREFDAHLSPSLPCLLGEKGARKHQDLMPLPSQERGWGEVELGQGEIGEIFVKGMNVTIGYANNLASLRDRWLPTGDLGYLDDEGFLYIVNRRTDLIVSGGENIYPAEIEAILSRHPAIREVCVVGLSDREWGQIVVAAIAATEILTLPEIRDFCVHHDLARYKLPKAIYLLDRLPKTASGKLARQQVRELL
jgi:o-succinylbenzoate---CoA ligase